MANRWQNAAELDYEGLFEEAATNSINPHVEAVLKVMHADAKRASDMGARWMPVTDLDDALVQLAVYMAPGPDGGRWRA